MLVGRRKVLVDHIVKIDNKLFLAHAGTENNLSLIDDDITFDPDIDQSKS